MRIGLTLTLCAAASTVLLTAGCGRDAAAKNQDQAGEAPPVPVTVETVGRATVKRTLVLSGSVQPESQVRLVSKVSGRIEELSADTCAEVRKGQVVARIDRELLAAVLRQAEAARAVAQVSLADKESDWTRSQKLFKEGAINEQASDKAKAARDMAASLLVQTEAATAAAKVSLDETEILATIDGTVTARFLDQGDFTNPGQSLFTVQDLRTVKVLASVPQADLPLLTPGVSRVRVSVEGVTGVFDAVVTKVEPALDAVTLSAPIELRVQNRRRPVPAGAPVDGKACAPAWVLASGMSARVELAIEERQDVPVLPLEAVRNDGKRDFVFITSDAGPKTTATRVDVKLGKLGTSRGEMGWLVELLGPGDLAGMRVVTEGVTRLTDGSKIQVVEKRAEPAKPAPAGKGADTAPPAAPVPGAAPAEKRQ